MKTCKSCTETLPLSEFPSNGPGYTRSRCKPCQTAYSREWRAERSTTSQRTEENRRWREANPEKVAAIKERKRLKRYGLEPGEYARLLADQGGLCAICGSGDPGPKGRWCIDHDHSCCPHGASCGECVRGLLCHHCNLALGLFRDDPELLASAISYVNGRA